jgi:hypothetical protein
LAFGRRKIRDLARKEGLFRGGPAPCPAGILHASVPSPGRQITKRN